MSSKQRNHDCWAFCWTEWQLVSATSKPSELKRRDSKEWQTFSSSRRRPCRSSDGARKNSLSAYARMRANLIKDAGHSDEVLVVIEEYLKANSQKFEGTVSRLLVELNALRWDSISDRNWVRETRWPTMANQLSRRMRSGVAGLRAMGIHSVKTSHAPTNVRYGCGGEGETGNLCPSRRDDKNALGGPHQSPNT